MNRRFVLKAAVASGLAVLVAACDMTASEPDIVDIAASNDDFRRLWPLFRQPGWSTR